LDNQGMALATKQLRIAWLRMGPVRLLVGDQAVLSGPQPRRFFSVHMPSWYRQLQKVRSFLRPRNNDVPLCRPNQSYRVIYIAIPQLVAGSGKGQNRVKIKTTHNVKRERNWSPIKPCGYLGACYIISIFSYLCRWGQFLWFRKISHIFTEST
jgi:hypothetical protein